MNGESDLPVTRAWLAWSSGKDSAWALHVCQERGDLEVTGLFTTVDRMSGRVGMHGVHRELVEAQAAAAGLPLRIVELPWPCRNEVYEAHLAEVWSDALGQGVEAIVFGDLFLADIRAYREQQLEGTSLRPIFPLWGLGTRDLADAMIEGGLRATVVAVDLDRLDADLVGRTFDHDLLRDLPAGIDPCGENGEFHSFVNDGPSFRWPVPTRVADRRERDGLAQADLVLV